MSTQENKALARRELEEIFAAKGNLDAAEEIYVPHYISHTNPLLRRTYALPKPSSTSPPACVKPSPTSRSP